MARIKRTKEEIENDIDRQSKVCCVCNIRLPFTSFYNYKNKSDGKSYRCKSCDDKASRKWRESNPDRFKQSTKNRSLKFKYGIDLEEYDNILKSQGGRCGICETTENTSAYGVNNSSAFSVDHCHKTGKVRGLLCNQCNRGIGMLGDTVESLEKALKYLKDTH
jgi:hypothetical protein